LSTLNNIISRDHYSVNYRLAQVPHINGKYDVPGAPASTSPIALSCDPETRARVETPIASGAQYIVYSIIERYDN
jgi:hypothetical protein